MQLWVRNAMAALEWTLLFPLIPAVVYQGRAGRALCTVHLTASIWAMAVAAQPGLWHTGYIALPVTLVVCWALHYVGLTNVSEPDGLRLTAVRVLGFLSFVNFLTATPLRINSEEHQFTLRICRAILHSTALVAGIVLGLFYAVILPTHEAWGCYPPSAALSDEKYGMCGTDPAHPGPGWWVSQSTKESEACIRYEKYANYDCKPPVSAAQSFGTYMAVGHNAALLSLASYCFGCAFAWEVGVDLSDN